MTIREIEDTERGRDRSPEGPIPASAAQEWAWRIERDAGRGAVNRLVAAWRLTGELDPSALGHGLNEIRARHQVLRTTLRMIGPRLTQVVAPHRPERLPSSTIEPGALRTEIDRIARRPIDPGQGPLVRWHLLRVRRREHVLVQSAHRTVFDEGSYGPFLRELGALYRAQRSGTAVPISRRREPYARFARSDRARAEGPEAERAESYWRRQLESPLPDLRVLPDPRLRSDRLAPSDSPSRAASVVPRTLGLRIGELAVASGTTPTAVFLAAFHLLLHRLTGSKDLLVEMPMATRDRRNLWGAIGCYTNTLPVRSDFSGDPDFRESVRRAARATMSAYRHRGFVVRREPTVFRPAALVRSIELPELPALPALDMEWIEADSGEPLADIELEIARSACEERVTLRAPADRGSPRDVRELLGRYQAVLEAALEDPDRPSSELRIAGEGGTSPSGDGWGPDPTDRNALIETQMEVAG